MELVETLGIRDSEWKTVELVKARELGNPRTSLADLVHFLLSAAFNLDKPQDPT